ncbi:hypothetical protein [Corynebacterium hindlerae]|uniref:hypothetical protein n=1 Tax=Corynebacterium hindlerae TaxID=699041 RepID=UPI003AAC21DE
MRWETVLTQQAILMLRCDALIQQAGPSLSDGIGVAEIVLTAVNHKTQRMRYAEIMIGA